MSSATFERPCRVETHVALDRASRWLTRNGYEVVSRSALDWHLFHQAGSSLSARIDQAKHRLTLRGDGHTLTFLFELTLPSSKQPGETERTELERRVDAATAAAHAQAAAAAVRAPDSAPHCATCGTVAAIGARTCEVCGSRL